MSAATEIDAYLDELLGLLRGRTPEVRRTLAEVEDHLRDAVAAGASEAEAIAAFGSPRAVARRFEPVGPAMWPSLISLAWRLVAVGLVAVGLSGLLALGMRATMGSSFVAGDGAGVTYTSTRCAELEALVPGAPSCGAAASAHHADEVALYRTGVGLLGALALAAWWASMRRRSSALPPDLEPVLAAAAFGLAALVLLGETVVSLAEGLHHGAGQWMAAAAVSAGFAVWYGRGAWRAIAIRSRTSASGRPLEHA
jgi:hypothetical protein